MAQNLRAKLSPEMDQMFVFDVIKETCAAFANEPGRVGVTVASDVCEVASNSVSHHSHPFNLYIIL